MKKKTENELPPLCAAVQRTRAAYEESQERFARRIDVAVMTISRFETGRAEPRDPRVLLNLARVAAARSLGIVGESTRQSLRKDEELFRDAYEDYERMKNTDIRVGALESLTQPPIRSMREWRLACAARISVLYFPEHVLAIEKAAGSALAIIDEILSDADENRIDYEHFEREVFALAERQTLKKLQKKKEKDQ